MTGICTETTSRRRRAICAGICLVLSVLAQTAIGQTRANSSRTFVVDVAGASRTEVARVRAAAAWSSVLGDVLVAGGDSACIGRAAGRRAVTPVEPLPAGDELLVGSHLHPSELAGTPYRLLASSGTLTLLAGPRGGVVLPWDATLRPLERGRVYAEALETPRRTGRVADRYADAVDGARWLATVTDLANFGTRYTGTAGANSARDYIARQFQALGLNVSTPSFGVGSSTGWNVVGELPGTTRADDVYIVCGHYDSISEDPATRAPGAEDNGSGSAGVVELARVFAANPPGATIRFIAFAGEEEGLYGSEDYVGRLFASGEARRVKGVINMDMIGFSRDADLDVLLETGESGRDLSNALADSAADVPGLRVVRSFNPFGSDHVPFIDAGIPCVLTIENDWDQYAPYHTSRDTIANVRTDMGSAILRMNAETIGRLAAGPPEGVLEISPRVPFDTNRRTMYGGFVQTIEWSVTGEDPDAFDVAYSTDGGASFAPVADALAGDARTTYWTVPNGITSANVVVRVTGRRSNGDDVSADTTDALAIAPSSGPELEKLLFKSRHGADIVVRGLFGSYAQTIEVNGAPIAGTIISTRSVDGNTTRHLLGAVDGRLDDTFPRGVEVRVRVVDLRTGLATAELAVTRR